MRRSASLLALVSSALVFGGSAFAHDPAAFAHRPAAPAHSPQVPAHGASPRAATAATSPAAPAKVVFVSPSPGKTQGRKVTFKVRVTGLRLDPVNVSKRLVPGAGHLHFAMDGGRFDFPRFSGMNGQIAAKSGTAGRWSPAVANTITYANLPPGRHTLKVMLADNLHGPLPGTAKLTFVVR